MEIPLQDRTHGGLEHRRLPAGHQTGQRTHLVGERHLLKAKRLQPRAELLLMAPIGGAVQQGNGDTAVAIGLRRGDGGLEGLIQHEGLELSTVGGQTALDLDHPPLQRLGPADGERKQIRAVLITDREQIGEALVDQQQGGGAVPLQEGIGSHGGAQAHLRHQARGYGF